MGFTNESEKVGLGWKGDGVKASAESATELQAYCHCKGVRFKITRPDESSARLVAPRGDIVGPPTTNEDGSGNDDAAWWLRENGTKYLGGTCACDECRLASGFDIQTWAFVPKANMKQLDGKPLDFNIGTLKRYDSSEGVYREFCGKCGATVFWHSDSRPDLIDVSVGLLDAEEGARAESWLGWKTERVSFEEEAQNKDLIARLSAGLKRWGEMRFPSSAKKHDLENEQTKSDPKKPETGGSV
ncbi:Mss4-like protein [Usnea florida]